MIKTKLQKIHSPWLNGLHGMIPSLVFMVFFLVAPYGTVAQTMTVGSPTLLYSNYSTGTTSDLSCPVLKDPANPSEVFSWTSNGQFAFAKFRGPLNDPQRTQIWSGYSGRWNFTGFPSGYRPWLGNIYKHTDGTLIGFVHIETAVYNDPNCQYRQGIAISTDNGDHWRYCGDVIKSQVDVTGQQENLGGCAVVKVGNYFYQYYNEYETGYFRKPAVARALIADVVAAAKNYTVTPWVKYYNGQWNRNALTEAGSSVLPYPTDRYDAHGDAVYCKPLGKYLMVVYEQTGYDYTPPYPISNARKGIYMYSSTDGVNWGDKRHVFVPQTGGDACYPFFGGITDASDDNLEVGGDFSLYVHDRERHELYRIPITVGTPPAPIAAPSLSPAGGTYSTGQTVTMTTATSGASIYYTTNGNTPNTGSLLYTSPVSVAASSTLKAIAYRSDLGSSAVTTENYYIGIGAELINNTGFEADLSGWTSNGPAISRVITQFNSGIASCRSGSRTANWNGPVQTIKTALTNNGPGNYTVSAYMKLATGTDLGRIQIGLTAGGTTTYPTVTGTINSSGWTLVTGTVDLSWSGTLEDAKFYVNTGSSLAEMYVDDCSLRKGSAVPLVVDVPTFNPPAGTYSSAQAVTISSATPGATIRYTVDGTAPTATNGSTYSSPVNIAANTTLRAYALKSGMTDSAGAAAVYAVRVADPAFTPAAGTYNTAQAVAISTATSGATVRYTVDGSEPTPTNGSTYSSPVNIAANTTLKAYALKSGMTDSAVVTGGYVIAYPSEVVNGGYENGSEGWTATSSNTSDAAYGVVNTQGAWDGIYAMALGSGNAAGNAILTQTLSTIPGGAYNLGFQYGAYGYAGKQQRLLVEVLDGTTVLASQLVTATGPGNLDPAQTTFQLRSVGFTAGSSTIVIRFTDQTTMANSNACDGMLDAVVLTAVVADVEAPAFSPPAGTYSAAQAVAINSATSGATIRYTVDGTAPTATNGSIYSTPVSITANTTLRAYAFKSGMGDSDETSGVYAINVPPPTNGISNGSFENSTTGWDVTASNGGTPAYGALNTQGSRDGSYALALGNGNAAGNAILTQSFTTTPGAPYTLGFQYGAYGYAGKQQRLLVEVLDGSTVLVSQLVTAYGPGNLDPAQTTFQLQSFGFTAGSPTTIVRFTDQTTLANSNACDGMLDAIGVTPVAGALPYPLVSGDVGTVGVAGSASEAWGVYTVAGSGSDIWGTADAFQFVQQAASGDCEITAKVTAVGNTYPWAKAGVMIRETLNDNSAYAMAVITPSNGACLMYRTTTGGTSSSTQSTGKAAPYWVRVKRVGNSFSSYMSPNGTTWTQIGTSKTIAMGSTAYIGLCLSSHDNAVLNTSTFENVSVAP
jgi:regulation of enolase protein 1 (concanavalin A-like superfamily)